MTETNKKKINLQDAIKEQLERKKQQGNQAGKKAHSEHSTKKLASQQTKKPNNQRKRMGV